MDRTNERRLTAVSGAGMDRALPPRRSWLRGARLGALVAVAAALAVAGYLLLRPEPQRTLAVEDDRITIAPVVRGRFDDYVQIRARALPARTTFVDTAQGGQVEAIHVEDGATVAKGQLLIELSNTALQLDAISREAQITEQLNNLRGLELAQEQTRLVHEREMVEVQYQIKRLTRQMASSESLVGSGVSPRNELDDMKDELAYYHKRLKVQT
jgi:HlyD family secretion protein